MAEGLISAASLLPKVPLPPTKPEPDFSINGFVITNSMLSSLAVIVLVVLLVVVATRRLERRPGRFQTGVEYVIGLLHNFSKDSAGETGERLFPIFAGLLIYILVANWFALIPGVGQMYVSNGKDTWPLFRAMNADLNSTLALALLAFTLIHASGIRARGIAHLTTYVNIPALTRFLRQRPKSPLDLLYTFLQGILDTFVGIFELIGEFAKIVSLSVRLFANIYGGEALIAVIITLFAPVAFFFVGLELALVAIVQALIFGLLTVVYISLVVTHEDEPEGHSNHDSEPVPEQAAA
jgi:F-type H+-transporting ATPase subunit a